MIELKPPTEIYDYVISDKVVIFVAGSIEMGKAKNWQKRVATAFKNEDVVLVNPRRDDWDSSWKQNKSNPKFREQVMWELYGLENADAILMYLDPITQSPITMLELGLFADSQKLRVVCPKGFWRKGNVDIVSEYYGVAQFGSLKAAIANIKDELPQLRRYKAF